MALIITVIVLLILAMVTISLIINSGIITKSKSAVDSYSEEEMIEQIKLANQEYQMARFSETNLSAADYISGRLEKIYDNVTVTPKSETQNYPMIVQINDFKYDLLGDGTAEKRADYETLESLYGTVVNGYTGYSATDVTEWKLLYVDEENREVFIISSNSLERTEIKTSKYTGSNSVQGFEYGKKYNGLWLEKCENENTNYNVKATAFLCDPDEWKKYSAGKAKYAAGCPTLEIVVASVYNKQISDFKDINYSGAISTIRNTNNNGYGLISFSINNDLFNVGNNPQYFIASPSNTQYDRMEGINSTGNVNLASLYNSFGFRPVVCLPATAILINGTGDNITLEYK